MAKWLDKYEQGGMVLKQKTHDNYGKKPNPNDVQASVGPNFVGLGYDTKGRDYSPAWGGQFAMGGALPGATGMMYARTQDPAPSNGPYAKKTKASAQSGIELIPSIASAIPSVMSGAKSLANKAISYIANTDLGKEKLQNFARNVDPYDYSTFTEPSSLERIYKAGIKNIKEPYREELDNKFKEGFASTQDSVRMDLLNRYAGLPEKYGTLKKSNYTPTKGNKNEAYSSSPQIERMIKEELPAIKTKKELEKWVSNAATYEESKKEKDHYVPIKGKGSNYVATIPALGQGTYGIGEDKEGFYLSYYDKWDLNPFSGKNAEPEIIKNSGGVEDKSKLNKIGRWMLGEENSSTATRSIGNPANIYGRIYFDKKTGKPKMQNGGEMQYYQNGLDWKPKSISKNGSVIKDDMGQWAHPGEITEIGSNNITMQGVDYPVLGVSDTGDTQMMQPNQDYKFDGEKVTEYPMMQEGGWLDKYQDGGNINKKLKEEAEEFLARQIANRTTMSQYTPKKGEAERLEKEKAQRREENAKPLSRLASNPNAEAFGRNIPDAALFALDVMTLGEASLALKTIAKPALKAAAKYATEKTALKNAYKLNPYAFKADPTKYYRQAGKAAYDDAMIEGKMYAKGQKELLEKNPNINYTDEYNASIAADEAGKFHLTKPANAPFVQKGKLFYPIDRKPTGAGYKGTKFADAEYLFEGALPDEAVLPRYQEKYLSSLNQSGGAGVVRPEYNDLNNFKTYQKNWLKGYKEVPKKEELINLYRIQEKEGKPFAQLAKEGKIPKAFNNPETIARKTAEEKHYGQWFTNDKADLDWYARDREFINPETIQLQVPKSKLSQYQNYDKTLSRAPDREFVIPQDAQKLYNQSSSSITNGPINYWEEPGFAKRNPNFNPEAYANSPIGNASASRDIPEGMTPYIKVDDVTPNVKPSWKSQELPGLHISATMEGGPISKIIEPKTGLINVDQALTIIGKESGGASKVDMIKQALGKDIPNKMDYNDFRKTVQDQLIPLEREVVDIDRSAYGINNIGFTKSKGLFARKPQAILDNIEYTKNHILKLEKTGDPSFKKYIGNLKQDLDYHLKEYNNIPLENQTIRLSNRSKFGKGADTHGNPEETLGHIHFIRDAESPDVLTMTQLQSDAFQSTNRTMPKSLEEANAKLNKLKDYANYNPSVRADYDVSLEEAAVKNFSQKSLLDKNHQERYLQELVDYAGKRGDINKIRVPTSETAAKVQGYRPVTTSSKVFEEYNKLKGTPEYEQMIANTPDADKVRLEKVLKGDIKGDIYDLSNETVLKKYSEQPKVIKKVFGVEPKTVKDSKGNSWYEFDIPAKFKGGKGEIKAFKDGGWLNKYK